MIQNNFTSNGFSITATGLILISSSITMQQLAGGGSVTLVSGIIGGLIALYGVANSYESKLRKFFKSAGLVNGPIVPAILKKIQTENGCTYIIGIPAGMCMNDFEKKKDAIEQYFKANVTLSFKKNLVVHMEYSDLKESYPFTMHQYDEPLKVAFAYSRNGVYSIDLEEAVHVLIAGATGAGKSVLLRAIITAFILGKDPKQVELHLVDFMRVELGIFKRSDRVAGFYYEPDKFFQLLSNLKDESSRRLQLFEKQSIVNIKTWNKRNTNNQLKYIVVFVDEFAALADKKYKNIMAELKLRAAQDRKCGIHYVLCTQRPSRDIIDGTIKANLPTRICLKTSSDSDSEIVLDERGAEKLRGKGHALVRMGCELDDIQTMYLSEEQAQKLIKHTYTKKIQTQMQDKEDTSGVMGNA